jgi:hypothetical protein
MPKKDFFSYMFYGEFGIVFCKIFKTIIIDFWKEIHPNFFS